MEPTPFYSSISEAHIGLTRREFTPLEIFTYISQNFHDSSAEKLSGSENDFHNFSVEFSKQNCDQYAYAIASIGCTIYPLSATLLADKIKYAQDSGKINKAQEGFTLLSNLDKRFWNWRTFVFSIDFLKDGLCYQKDVASHEANLTKAKELVDEFKKAIPHEERAYVADAELYEQKREYDNAIAALQEGIEKVSVAPQCCMKLSDMYLERGKYEDASKYASKGIIAALQEQPSASVAYLFYLKALSLDGIRLIKKSQGCQIDETEATELMNTYFIAEKLFDYEGRSGVAYKKTISARCLILSIEEGIPLRKHTEETNNPAGQLALLKEMLSSQ